MGDAIRPSGLPSDETGGQSVAEECRINCSRAPEDFRASPGCVTMHQSAAPATGFSSRLVGVPWLLDQYRPKLISPSESAFLKNTKTGFRCDGKKTRMLKVVCGTPYLYEKHEQDLQDTCPRIKSLVEKLLLKRIH
ncbi:Hypothetical protein CINCED_3A015610 [Cinara cedri]|uniref:Uncharacterized protein n=1 Tax=Cinara cedri TaxID=506608 RepID=A0A5E4N2D8_9HEMI|nr:Hypothetical protein CINCED_3A015610 [Cinara cedri]